MKLWFIVTVVMFGATACVPTLPISISITTATPAAATATLVPATFTPTRVPATPTATMLAAASAKYNSVDWGFILAVPQGWSIAKEWPGRPTSPQQSNGVVFFSPKEDAEIFIGVRLHQNRSADQWMDDLEAQVPSDMQYRRVSRDTVKFQDVEAVRVESTFDRPPPYRSGHGPQRRKTFVLVRSQYVYEIDVSADAPVWEQYRPVFNDFLNQWTWHTTLLVRGTPTTPRDAWTTYRSKEGRFSVGYPSRWKVNEKPKDEKGVILGEWYVDGVEAQIFFWSLSNPTTPEALVRDFTQKMSNSAGVEQFVPRDITASTMGGLAAARADFLLVNREGSFLGSYVATIRQNTAHVVYGYVALTRQGTPIPDPESRRQIRERILASFTLE